MKKKDLIDVILKIGGLFTLLQIIASQIATAVILVLDTINLETIIYIGTSFTITSLVLYFFVLRTDKIIYLMKIDEESLIFKNADISKSNFLSDGIVLIGVFIIVNSIINILIEFTEFLINFISTGEGSFGWYSFIYLIVGLILITLNKKIVRLINKR